MPATLPELRLLAPPPATTRAFGERLGIAAAAGDVIALIGPLGAGKTEFARGIARGLGVVGLVSSPTFILIAEHEGRLPLFHLDCYRLAGPEDALGAGLLDDATAWFRTAIAYGEPDSVVRVAWLLTGDAAWAGGDTAKAADAYRRAAAGGGENDATAARAIEQLRRLLEGGNR